MAVTSLNSLKPLKKRDILGIVALSIAFLGLFWAALPFALAQEEKKEVSEVVVDIAQSVLEAVKGEKSLDSQPPLKSFLDKLAENSLVGSLAIAATSFVLSIIIYIMGAKGRLFIATMAVNISTVALNVLLVALVIALIFVVIWFIEFDNFSFFD